MSETSYIPGVCNINHAEIAYRRKVAIGGITLAVVLFVLLTVLSASPFIRAAVIFLPLLVGILNAKQVRNKFCVSYGGSGQHNADDGHIGGVTIEDTAAVAADKKKARAMNMEAIGISAAIVIVSLLVPTM